MSWCCVPVCLRLAPVLMLLLVNGCGTPRAGSPDPVRRSQPLLGTFVTITAYGADRAAVNTAISAAFDEFRKVDASMSIHRPESELSRLNALAANGPVTVSPELFDVIAASKRIGAETRGSFDVTIRPLADLWGFIWKRDYRFPADHELSAALSRVNSDWVELNPETRTVRFVRPGISIDLGGIGKGYAVDRALERLQAMGVSNVMVKAGGDLRVIGAPPGTDGWTVQLEDPEKRGGRVSVTLRDRALSTSGDYENFFEHEGRRYSHILDPRTGFPVRGVAACTVIAPTCMESDAWATACFIYGAGESLRDFSGRFSMRFTLRPDDPVQPLRVVQSPGFPVEQQDGRGSWGGRRGYKVPMIGSPFTLARPAIWRLPLCHD